MKTKLVLTAILTSFLFMTGCSNEDANIEESESLSKSSSVDNVSSAAKKGSAAISQEYAQAQQEVLETFGAIGQAITDGAGMGPDSEYMNQLISFHGYGPKFTEFNYDQFGTGTLYDSAGNEQNERTLFGTIVDPGGVVQFAAVPGSLKVAVYYGNVASLTFISDFHLMIGGELNTINNLISLLFVKTQGDWKLVHEHHSPGQL